MVPPECGDFFDHLQITSIFQHMISCTNKARFPRFYIFLFLLNLYCTLDWLIKTSVYTSRGHCKIYIFKFFFHSHVLHMWVTMYKKIWVIWRWWKNSRFFKNWLKLKDQMVPPGMRAFFSTTSKSPQFWHTWSLPQTKLGFQVFVFLIFFEFIMPSRLTSENIGLCLKGAL